MRILVPLLFVQPLAAPLLLPPEQPAPSVSAPSGNNRSSYVGASTCGKLSSRLSLKAFAKPPTTSRLGFLERIPYPEVFRPVITCFTPAIPISGSRCALWKTASFKPPGPGKKVELSRGPSAWTSSSDRGRLARRISTGEAANSFSCRFPISPRQSVGSTVPAIRMGRRTSTARLFRVAWNVMPPTSRSISEEDPMRPYLSNAYSRDNSLAGNHLRKMSWSGRVFIRKTGWKDPVPGATADIVHPGQLGRELQMALCAQCHSGHLVPRNGPFSFKPGQGPEAFIAVESLRARNSGGVHTTNQPERLRRSQCFQESGSMTCMSCHDPHHLERGNLQAFFPALHDLPPAPRLWDGGSLGGCHRRQLY